MHRVFRYSCVLVLLTNGLALAQSDSSWVSLFDGKSLAGWKGAEHPNSFRVEDGAIVCDGPRAHLFYVGSDHGASWKNFELKVNVLAKPGSNSGVFFHTAYQDQSWPKQGFEVQVNNSQQRHGNYYEYKKTGSLYGVNNLFFAAVKDNEWFEMKVVVRGKTVETFLNNRPVVSYTEPTDVSGRNKLGSGTFAFQCHDPGSKVYFKDIQVRALPADLPDYVGAPPQNDEIDAKILALQQRNFPVINLHVHLKGGLTLEQCLAKSRATNINHGIAVNCGKGFPVESDAGIYEYLKMMKGQPCLVGMQAEGREWVDMFSPEAIEKFDYVFTDAMTWTDDKGRRMRLWMPDEVFVDDPQQFMDMLVKRIEGVMTEPINIYVNPLYLPKVLAADFDQLWTKEREDRVIAAAAKNGVAIEISDRHKQPSADFIKRAKQAGVKFTFGVNNGGPELGRLEYCLQMVEECGLKPADMYVPVKKHLE